MKKILYIGLARLIVMMILLSIVFEKNFNIERSLQHIRTLSDFNIRYLIIREAILITILGVFFYQYLIIEASSRGFLSV